MAKRERSRSWLAAVSVLLLLLLLCGGGLLWYFWNDIVPPVSPEEHIPAEELTLDREHLYFGGDLRTGTGNPVSYSVVLNGQTVSDPGKYLDISFGTDKPVYIPGETVYFSGKLHADDDGEPDIKLEVIVTNGKLVSDKIVKDLCFFIDGKKQDLSGEFTMPVGSVTLKFTITFKK